MNPIMSLLQSGSGQGMMNAALQTAAAAAKAAPKSIQLQRRTPTFSEQMAQDYLRQRQMEHSITPPGNQQQWGGEVEDIYRGWDRTDPRLKAFYERLAAESQQRFGMAPKLGETWRPQERQDWLYAQGRTRPGDIVTKTRNSRHTRGMAIDIIPPKGIDTQTYLPFARQLADSMKIRYLGDLDPWHFQL